MNLGGGVFIVSVGDFCYGFWVFWLLEEVKGGCSSNLGIFVLFFMRTVKIAVNEGEIELVLWDKRVESISAPPVSTSCKAILDAC